MSNSSYMPHPSRTARSLSSRQAAGGVQREGRLRTLTRVFRGIVRSGILLLALATAELPAQPVGLLPDVQSDHWPSDFLRAEANSDGPEGTVQERALHILALEAFRRGVGGDTEIPCTHGGVIRPECREDGNGTNLLAELRTCRLELESGEILNATGQLQLGFRAAGTCPRPVSEPCGPVTIEQARTVATVTDQHGKVLRVMDLSNLPAPRTIVVPCANGAPAQPRS